MKVLNFEKYQLAEDLSNFIANPTINESDNKDSQINGILKKLSQDLKFNYGLVFTFGVGVRVMYPIVEGLISNGSLKVEPTMENIVLVSIAALTITYLEESKNKAGDSEVPCNCKNKSKECEKCGGTGVIKSIVTKQDARTILEELKLRGIGNGIVKGVVKSFISIGNLMKVIFKNLANIINNK